MAANSGQRSGDAAAGVGSAPDPRCASRVPRIPAPAARVVHLGKDAGGSRPARGNSGIPAGELRTGEGGVMALIKIGGGKAEAGAGDSRSIEERTAVVAFL